MYAIFAYAGGCVDKLLMFPSTAAEDAAGAERRTVVVQSKTLETWVARSNALTSRDSRPAGYVIEFTGNASRAEWVAKDTAWHWRDQPVEVWAVNYPGYGGSEGKASLRSIGPASVAVYDHLRAQSPDAPIFVTAESLGTTAALYLATQRPVAGLVLSNPPPLRQLILGRFGWWNLWLIAGPVALGVPAELDSLANAKKLTTTPAVFLTSLADDVVPSAYQRKVIDAYAGPKRVIDRPGALHNTPYESATRQALQEGIAWVWGAATSSTTTK